MPINVYDPEYVKAEKDYFEANTLEERLIALRKMISHAPKHKGGENLRQQLTTRRKKLEEQIIIFNKIDKLSEQEHRKISATLQSKKYNFILISTKTKQNIEELKEKIFKSFDSIRIFTKEPGKEKSPKPVIIKPNSTVGDIAEKILKGFSKKIKQTKIWGPSSKFAGQSVGLKHKLKDLDVVEFRTN